MTTVVNYNIILRALSTVFNFLCSFSYSPGSVVNMKGEVGTLCRETIKNYFMIMTVQMLLHARTLCTRCIVGVNDALFAHVSVLLLIAPTLVDNTACIC